MKDYFKLLGWESLLMIIIGMLMLRSQIFIPFYNMYFPFTIIPSSEFVAFSFGAVFMMASFNVICSYYDGKMQDIIDNKQQKEDTQQTNKYKMFWVLCIIALGLIGFVSIKNNAWQVLAIAVVFECGAYFYALKYKREYLIGNIMISLLFALIVFLPLFLEFFAFKNFDSPFTLRIPKEGMQDLFSLFAYFGGFVFLLCFVRDLTVDLANLEDNKKNNLVTFPVKEGVRPTKTLLVIASCLFMILNIYFMYRFYDKLDTIHIIFICIIVLAPMVYYIISLMRAKLPMYYAQLYQTLGIIYIALLFVIFFCNDIFKIDATL